VTRVNLADIGTVGFGPDPSTPGRYVVELDPSTFGAGVELVGTVAQIQAHAFYLLSVTLDVQLTAERSGVAS
jgi:hypothetical protein